MTTSSECPRLPAGSGRAHAPASSRSEPVLRYDPRRRTIRPPECLGIHATRRHRQSWPSGASPLHRARPAAASSALPGRRRGSDRASRTRWRQSRPALKRAVDILAAEQTDDDLGLAARREAAAVRVPCRDVCGFHEHHLSREPISQMGVHGNRGRGIELHAGDTSPTGAELLVRSFGARLCVALMSRPDHRLIGHMHKKESDLLQVAQVNS